MFSDKNVLLKSNLCENSNIHNPELLKKAGFCFFRKLAASQAERTIRLLQDLLDLARVDSAYLHFQMKSYVLNYLVEEIVVMAEKYSDRQINIRQLALEDI